LIRHKPAAGISAASSHHRRVSNFLLLLERSNIERCGVGEVDLDGKVAAAATAAQVNDEAAGERGATLKKR
jgi:hypothetical protein